MDFQYVFYYFSTYITDHAIHTGSLQILTYSISFLNYCIPKHKKTSCQSTI